MKTSLRGSEKFLQRYFDAREVRVPKKLRCRKTAIAIDGSVPYEERCVLVAGHDGQHECCHGFHF